MPTKLAPSLQGVGCNVVLFQKTNPAELLKLYLTFGLLTQALHLAMEYIDGVMGHGREFFALEVCLRIFLR